MTTRERIAKGIRDHDAAVEEARLCALINVSEPFIGPSDAFESAKGLAKQAGIMFSRLAQRREAVRNIGLLDYENSKQSKPRSDDHCDAGPEGMRIANKLRDKEDARLEEKFGPER